MRALILTFAAFLVFNVNTTNASLISFDPSVSVINAGSSVDIDVVISDLGSETLGGFFLDVLFDDTILAFNSASYSDALGMAGLETDFLTTLGSDLVTLDNFSFLSISELDAIQDSSFVLATINFSGIGAGISDLNFSILDFASGDGIDITDNVDTNSGSVEVLNVTNIPEPFTLMLLLPSFVLMTMFRNKA